MNQWAAAQGDTYQVEQYSTAAPPPTMYSGQPLQSPSYSDQPLQPPPMAATAPQAVLSYPPQATYEAAKGCMSTSPAYSDPLAAGAYLQTCAPGYAPAFYPGQAHYQPPQQSVNVEVSTAPSVTVVHQPPPVTTPGIVKSYLAWSLVSLIIFCWPLGIPALICSLRVKSATASGDKSKYSLMARNFNIAATVVGPLLVIIVSSSIKANYYYASSSSSSSSSSVSSYAPAASSYSSSYCYYADCYYYYSYYLLQQSFKVRDMGRELADAALGK